MAVEQRAAGQEVWLALHRYALSRPTSPSECMCLCHPSLLGCSEGAMSKKALQEYLAKFGIKAAVTA